MLEISTVESPVQDVTVDETVDLLRDPYPLFAQKRRESGVFRGTVMDWSKTPDSHEARAPLRRGVLRRGQPGLP